MSVGTTEWIATLTLDQLRFARSEADAKIKAAEAQPKRTVWRVCLSGYCDGNYREDEYEKAADHLVRIFKEKFMKEAAGFVEAPYGTGIFERQLPSISAERVTQFEYETEWFPEKPS
jgi:hypothetical protein